MLPTIINPSFVNDFFTNFDSLFKDISTNVDISFPKYNAIKKGDDKIAIEIAVAGYSKENIEVSVKNNILMVKGNKQDDKNDNDVEYLRKEIASRSFYKRWTLPRNFEVKNANIKDGILYLDCQLHIPEQEKQKLIEIN